MLSDVITSLVPTLVLALIWVLVYLARYLLNKHKDKISQVDPKLYEFLNDSLASIMCEVENTSFNGVEKKKLVMTRVMNHCALNKIKYDEKATDEAIEKIIDTSKQINYNKKEVK